MFGHDSNQDQQMQNDTSSIGLPPSAPMPTDNPIVDPTPTAVLDSSLEASETAVNSSPIVDDDLLSIKQQALQQLSPLLGHLEQSPEEKFRTTMMMIQAADDQSLIKDAYEAAKQIADEKVRAQALLDVVNEINYFTQHQAN